MEGRDPAYNGGRKGACFYRGREERGDVKTGEENSSKPKVKVS